MAYLGLALNLSLSLPSYTIQALYQIRSLCASHTIQLLEGLPLEIKGVQTKRKVHLLLIKHSIIHALCMQHVTVRTQYDL